MSRHLFALLAIALAGSMASAPAQAGPPLSVLDSFRVGDRGVLCTAQRRSEDDHFRTMFDRSYEILCRDAATPVGHLYALRGENRGGDAAVIADAALACGAPAQLALDGMPGLRRSECHDQADSLTHVIYGEQRGKTLFLAEGLAAYDSALRIALHALIADRAQPGEILVATTGADDPAMLARLQAQHLDPAQALAAGYDRANQGSYPEAAEYFDSLAARARSNERGATRPAEYLANLALEQSILGNRAQAELFFAEAIHAGACCDAAFSRLLRNFRAMHQLSGNNPDGALATLDAPLPPDNGDFEETNGRMAAGFLDIRLSQRLEVDDSATNRFWGGASPLSDRERADLLDAQALYLRGVALGLKGDRPGSKARLEAALAAYAGVREGKVVSMAWLVADIDTELAALADAAGDPAGAETDLQRALAATAAQLPETAALIGARARLAGMQARHGKTALAIPTFRELVRTAAATPGGSEALRGEIEPYFDALVARRGDSGSAADFFVASQAMIRPGVAQTQAVFARELQAGSDAASDLFRQSVTLARELVRLDAEIARLSAIESRKPDDDAALATDRERRGEVAAQQTVLAAKLSAFPKYRVTSNPLLELAELQKNLRGDEAYYKLVLVGEAGFAIFIQPHDALIYKLAATRAQLETLTDQVRDSIVLDEGNQLITNPFDLTAAHQLYLLLFGAVADRMPHIHHLIFEPDGPLLKLPANVLVTDQASIDAYQARQNGPNPDNFDFTGTAWLGRDHVVSTAVSASSFIDLRQIAPSTAPRRFLGVGQNALPSQDPYAPQSDAGRDPCDWSLSIWKHPVSGDELRLAARVLGGKGDEVITGLAFTDTMLRERRDLADFQVIQFSTHGLVTAPHPGCPARPALVTSFGPRDSNGLLSFKQIFDLHLNAETVILSACDTAGAASVDATREAGITTGGNFALDGLVRAFVGAGSRTVIASHWPVPDDFGATTKLMSGLYAGGSVEGVGEAMRKSQVKLMDDPLTSHPYYWAAFAIVGDATRPLAR